MSNLNVTYDEMESAATRLTSAQDTITGELNGLKTFIQGLIHGGFVTDQASVAFGDSYTQFTNGATQTISALTNLGGYLTSAADTLRTADSDLAAGLRQ